MFGRLFSLLKAAMRVPMVSETDPDLAARIQLEARWMQREHIAAARNEERRAAFEAVKPFLKAWADPVNRRALNPVVTNRHQAPAARVAPFITLTQSRSKAVQP